MVVINVPKVHEWTEFSLNWPESKNIKSNKDYAEFTSEEIGRVTKAVMNKPWISKLVWEWVSQKPLSPEQIAVLKNQITKNEIANQRYGIWTDYQTWDEWTWSEWTWDEWTNIKVTSQTIIDWKIQS